MEWEQCHHQQPSQVSVHHHQHGEGSESMMAMQHPQFQQQQQPQPYLEILVQPQPKFRFRYKSEMTGKHGSLLGVQVQPSSPESGEGTSATGSLTTSASTSTSTSGGQSRLYPTVKLHNFHGEAIIRGSLVCDTKPHYPHPHLLEMTPTTPIATPTVPVPYGHGHDPSTSSGEGYYPCYVEVPVSAENDYTAVFQGLNIIFVGKKESRRVLQYKMSQIEDPNRIISPAQIDDLALTMNPNVVCLYFEAIIRYPGHLSPVQLCKQVASSPVQHNKSTQTGELRIVRIDKFSSCCTGDEEVFILVEKVDKHNIQIKFYEENDKGLEIWKAYGKFSKLDVHHQYAIVFKTPPYRSFDIDSEIDVWIQLERPSDSATSPSIPFRYRPIEQIRKVAKRQPRLKNEEESNQESSESQNQSSASTGQERQGNQQNQAGQSIPGTSNVRQGQGSSFQTMGDNNSDKSKALAMSVALSICQGLHGWAETSDLTLVLQKVRHLLCLVNGNGDNALHSSIINQQKDPFLLILDTLSTFPDTQTVINEPNFQSLTPLHLAVGANRMDFVIELLRHNADTSLQNSEGDTPLHIAVRGNNIQCVKYLLQSPSVGVAINKFNYSSMSPLLIAVAQGYTELVEILCSHKASLTIQEGTYGRTPLHMAVEKETKESIISTMIILKAGRDQDLPNLQNYAGNTPLHVAASAGFTTLCALLMHHGADPLIENHVRLETDEDEEDQGPKPEEEEEEEEEDRPSGQTVFDMVTNEKVQRVLKGTVDDWEIILKAVSPLLIQPFDTNTKDKDFESRPEFDSGLDADTFNSSQYLSSASSNQLS